MTNLVNIIILTKRTHKNAQFCMNKYGRNEIYTSHSRHWQPGFFCGDILESLYSLAKFPMISSILKRVLFFNHSNDFFYCTCSALCEYDFRYLGDIGAIGHLDVCVNGGLTQPFCANSECKLLLKFRHWTYVECVASFSSSTFMFACVCTLFHGS